MKKQNNTATIELVLSMMVFGSVGIFRRMIPFPSGFVAMARGVIGVAFLILVLLLKRKKPAFSAIRKSIAPLIISGALIGFNWMLLFEAYNYTSVAVATLCYYMAPIFVIIASPLLLGERLTAKKWIVTAVALIGMLLVSDILKTGVSSLSEIKGILLALGAAILYAAVIIMNKKLSDVPSYEKCTTQLTSAFAVLIPYVIFAETVTPADFTPKSIILLLTIGILHTGISYALYFDAIGKLDAQKVAIFAYIDPILALLLSAFILKEDMSITAIIGATLIIGATMIYDIPLRKNKNG